MLLAAGCLDVGLCVEPPRGSPSTPLFGRVDSRKVSFQISKQSTSNGGGIHVGIWYVLVASFRWVRHTQGLWCPPPGYFPTSEPHSQLVVRPLVFNINRTTRLYLESTTLYLV